MSPLIVTIMAILALPVASLVLAPTNHVLVRIDTSLVMTAVLLWLLLFWTMVLQFAWPLVAKLLQTTPLILQLLQLLPH